VILADTSGLLALFDRNEPAYEAVRTVVEAERDPLIVSPYVIAELDYLVATRVGVDAELAVLRELASGAWELPQLDARDLERATEVIDRFADQAIGLADASIVVLAERYATRRVLTLDHRHFEVLRRTRGGRFEIVPAR